LHEDDILINNELVQKHVYLVVPFLDDATVLMVRQYRYVLSAWNLEFPGGIIDHGEHAGGAAQRELEEETGFHSSRSTPTRLTHFFRDGSATKRPITAGR
jgi:8-oxo-dGTP pyrophosphatase MutT (NUDIX family)